MDFILKTYKNLLKALKKEGFSFQTFQEFIQQPREKSIVLRHDVDKLPENSLRFAQIQHELGIKGTYFFRIVPESFDPDIIEQIAELGHEIGYHYEDVDLASKKLSKPETWHLKPEIEKKLAEQAIQLFTKHLEVLRKIAPITTICMHGSPLSKYDNKLLWKYYNYKDFGIIGEPYFDVDFTKVLYLTDTGRRWDGEKVSVRDKVVKSSRQSTPNSYRDISQRFKRTGDIIQATEKGKLLSEVEGPEQIMFTFHPQRWTDDLVLWTKEFILQNVKNVVKYILNKFRE